VWWAAIGIEYTLINENEFKIGLIDGQASYQTNYILGLRQLCLLGV